jgi:replicative DNA helicase
MIDNLYIISEEDRKTDFDWLFETTEKWCKDRAIYLAIIKSIGIIDGKEKDQAPGAIPDILSKALGVSFDRNIGHDYIENAEQRYEFYNTVENKLPFDIELLNTITKGGVSNKTLNVLMASTGVGKSLVLCHFASSYLAQSKNVLYITMEMSEERIAERIDANLFDVDIGSIQNMGKRDFTSRIDKIKMNTHGKLVIKEYPTASAHVGHFRALVDELKLKKEFVPDVICVDYLNICASSRLKATGDTYSYVKSIAEEIRGLAIELDVPIWTATQSNRSGYQNSDVDLNSTSESFGLPATADLFLALISTEELEDMDQIMVKQLKNRYGDLSKHRRFVVGIDKPKMKLYDAEQSAQDDIMPEISSTTTPTTEFDEFKY